MTLSSGVCDSLITDSTSPGYGSDPFEPYQQAYTPWDWHKPIMDLANSLGHICLSSPFDTTAVDFLVDLGVPALKVASFENNHTPLIEKAVSMGKPLIISTGMETLSELEMAFNTSRNAGCAELILLKCTSTYPASVSNTNISTTLRLKFLFNVQVVITDHTPGIGVSVASVPLVSSVIEKHFTLNRKDGGVDSIFSLEPEEMSSLALAAKSAWLAMVKVFYGSTKDELESLHFKRSIFVKKEIKKGDVFSYDNIGIYRPGLGAQPSFFHIY